MSKIFTFVAVTFLLQNFSVCPFCLRFHPKNSLWVDTNVVLSCADLKCSFSFLESFISVFTSINYWIIKSNIELVFGWFFQSNLNIFKFLRLWHQNINYCMDFIYKFIVYDKNKNISKSYLLQWKPCTAMNKTKTERNHQPVCWCLYENTCIVLKLFWSKIFKIKRRKAGSKIYI